MRISEVEISEIIQQVVQGQIEIEDTNTPDDTPYIKLVNTEDNNSNFKEFILTVENGETKKLEKFKIKVEAF